MNTIVHRLIEGYQTIFRTTFRLFVAVLILSGLSVAISLPMWFIAVHAPLIFDGLVVLALGAVAVFAIVRRSQRMVRADTNRWRVIQIAILLVFLVIGLGGILGGALIIGLPFLILASGLFAWRTATR